MSTSTPGRRYAPPRSQQHQRRDPFTDFLGSGTGGGVGGGNVDHHTILSSLASERADAAEKRELAKQAGSLLRKMEQPERGRGGYYHSSGASQHSSVGRDSNVSSSADQHQHQNQQQPVSQLKRLQMTMDSLRRERNGESHIDQNDEDDDDESHHARGRGTSSPSKNDFTKFMKENNNTNSFSSQHDISGVSMGLENQNSFSVTSAKNGGGGIGLSNHTAQNILRDMQGLRDGIGKLETHLMSDMKRRVEGHAALQRTVEIRVREIAENAEKRGQDRMVKLHHTLDALTQRVSKLEDALSVEREKNARLVQELKYHSARGLQDIRQQLDVERNARSERIATASRNFSQDLFRVEEHISVAKRAREALSEEVQDAIVKANELRAENEDKILQSLMNDIRLLKGKLESETKEREVGEEQLAGAMADLAQHLQEL